MSDIINKIADAKLIPIITIDRVEDAIPLAKAIIDGGLPVMEITFRTDAAEESIRTISKMVPEALIGAGTITTLERVKKAHLAGSQFIITPGVSTDVLDYCRAEKLPVFPGICTPTDVMQVMEFGVEIVKFFPVALFGGVSAIKAFSGPFPTIRFIPTGGISESDLHEYLALSKVIACGGSWMVKTDMINAGDFDGITALVKKAVALVESIK